MAGTILLIIALFVAALLLFAAEICTPVFGILVAAGLGCLAWMAYLCFTLNQIFGVVMVLVLIFVVPAYIWAAVKFLPRTFIGRALQLQVERKRAGEGTPEAADQAALVGEMAVAETMLRPSGAIRVAGKRLIATAESGIIAKGANVKIIRAIGMNVVVRELKDSQ